MKVILGGRASGKTTKLAKQCIKEDGFFLVQDNRRAELVRRKFGLTESNCGTIEDLLKSRGYGFMAERKELFVDDADDLLAHLIGRKPSWIAMSVDGVFE